jgi:regulator of sigma E protease
MLTTLVFIFILGLLVIVHEFGHFIAAKRSGVKVEKFSVGFGPKVFSFKKNKTEYAVSVFPLGGYVKLAGDNLAEYKGEPDEYLAQPVFKRFQIIFSGPLLNYILAFLFFWLIFWAGYPTLTSKVGGVMKGYGAMDAGIAIGDRITAIEDKPVKTWEEVQQTIQENQKKPEIKVNILRNDQPLVLSIKLTKTSQSDELGQKRSLGLIGVKPDSSETVIIRYGFLESGYHGLKRTVNLTAMTYKALWFMISGKLSIRDSVTGPVGMFMITSEVTKMGLVALLHWVAVLSLSLGIFNILPFPVLDGGHIFLLLVEKIRGKGLSAKADDIFSRTGMGFLIFVAALVFLNDIYRYGFVDKVTNFFKR